MSRSHSTVDSQKVHVHVFVSWCVLCALQFKLESRFFVKNEQTRVTDKGGCVCICQARDEVGKYGPTHHVNNVDENAQDLAELYDHQTALGAPNSPQTSDEMSSVAGRVKDRKHRRDVHETYTSSSTSKE